MFDVSDDAQAIYDQYFKNAVEQLKTFKGDPDIPKSRMFSTAKLKSKAAQQAHELNPGTIKVWTGGNFYSPRNTIIEVGLNKNVIDILELSDSFNQALQLIPSNLHKRFKSEFEEHRIVGSIAHEISHWIDDTLHNYHIKGKVEKARELDDTRGPHSSKSKKITARLSDQLSAHEINAQIHQMKEVKNKISPERWDSLTIEELIDINPSTSSTKEKLILKDVSLYQKWKRLLLTRLHREGLLGKAMAKALTNG